jgi:nucleoside permease NupC
MIMSYVFSPLAYLIGIQGDEVGKVAELLGTKLVLNEFVAYSDLAAMHESQAISERSMRIATYALCGFANFGAVGIQIGGIGVLAPKRRGDLAQLAFRALYGGFVASLISAAIAGLFMGL